MSLLSTGELAQESLDSFVAIKTVVDTGESDIEHLVNEPAARFVTSSLALASKLPGQAKAGFSLNLPFSEFELGLLRIAQWQEHVDSRREISQRMIGWLSLGAYQVNGHVARCSSYLITLSPFLDIWEQRSLALSLADMFDVGL